MKLTQVRQLSNEMDTFTNNLLFYLPAITILLGVAGSTASLVGIFQNIVKSRNKRKLFEAQIHPEDTIRLEVRDYISSADYVLPDNNIVQPEGASTNSEVGRRLHNDARRFARLLASEIRLYSEKKIEEGSESQDLYERLREAIDRSREKYDKRIKVQPFNPDEFSYFLDEFVDSFSREKRK